MSTNVPAPQFTTTGLVLPTEPEILAGVLADYSAAFGGNLNPALNTPQGQLASSETAIIGGGNDLFAQYVNQVDPAYAAGRMQDGIGRIYFIERLAAAPTTVAVTLNGLADVPVPAGWQVGKDVNGNIYVTVDAVTIPSGGTLTGVQVVNQKTGPIPCPTGAINTIYRAIPGLDTITNPAEGVPGRDVESRADFEYRRQQSVALNGRGSLPAIYGAVFEVSGVLDVYCYENTNNAPITVGTTSYVMLEHSIYVCASGGADADIAQAIWLEKDCGCDYNGNTSVTVYDQSGYAIPYPSYAIKFNRPTATTVSFLVQIANNSSLPSNLVSLVQNYVVSAFVGGDGGQRARIGSTIYASRFYAGIVVLSPFIGIVSLLVDGSPFVTMGIDQAPTCTTGDVVVQLV